jgi:hypothetical protein
MSKPSYKAYDDEFTFGDENDPKLAQEVEEYSKTRHEQSSTEAKEELNRQHEINEASRAQFRHPDQDLMTQRREGRIIHYLEFVRLLNEHEINVRAADGLRQDQKGLWALVPTMGGGQWKYITWMQVPYMQEYEEINVDDYGVMTNQKRRGWRTVLLCLIKQGILTEELAHSIFGKPSSAEFSSIYLRDLHSIRNHLPTKGQYD